MTKRREPRADSDRRENSKKRGRKTIDIILASKSPRRRELLRFLGIDKFIVVPPEADEEIKEGSTPVDTVCNISREKAAEIYLKHPDSLVIAADTMVFLGDSALGKPSDEDEARRMLTMLSGNKHTVITGVTVICGGKELTKSESTDVYFKELSSDEIDDYVSTNEPMDKAGAYGAQGLGSVFIKRIDGDFYNVVGLPLFKLNEILSEMGISIFKLIKDRGML